MTEFVRNLEARTPFKMFIIHEQGSLTESNKMPILKRGKTNLPNMKWAMNTLTNYRIARVKKAIFYENGVEFGIYENGSYQGKYKTFD